MLATILGLVLPPAFSFIQDKFGKSKTPEQTIGHLAQTKPEVLDKYIQAITADREAETKFFNRDVIGTVSPWVADLRASIRPITVVFAMLILAVESVGGFSLEPLTRESLLFIVSSWFGCRILTGKG